MWKYKCLDRGIKEIQKKLLIILRVFSLYFSVYFHSENWIYWKCKNRCKCLCNRFQLYHKQQSCLNVQWNAEHYRPVPECLPPLWPYSDQAQWVDVLQWELQIWLHSASLYPGHHQGRRGFCSHISDRHWARRGNSDDTAVTACHKYSASCLYHHHSHAKFYKHCAYHLYNTDPWLANLELLCSVYVVLSCCNYVLRFHDELFYPLFIHYMYHFYLDINVIESEVSVFQRKK